MTNLSNYTSSSKVKFLEYDHLMWKKLYEKQYNNLLDKACSTFIKNLIRFDLPTDRIPTLKEISDKLYKVSKWSVIPVKGLLDNNTYFTFLKKRKFPVSMFIRNPSNLNLSPEPDIFHEIFGHCTMLLSEEYAEFLTEYGKFALASKEYNRPLLARLIWFTTETGLILEENKLKIFGSSILSSYEESIQCLTSSSVIRKPFNLVSIFREPYRTDVIQNVYYVLENTTHIFDVLNDTQLLSYTIKEARNLGELPTLFPNTDNSKLINVNDCNCDKKNKKL